MIFVFLFPKGIHSLWNILFCLFIYHVHLGNFVTFVCFFFKKRKEKKKSREPDSNQWPKDINFRYSPPLYQLSYHGITTLINLIDNLFIAYTLRANYDSRHSIGCLNYDSRHSIGCWKYSLVRYHVGERNTVDRFNEFALEIII